MAGGALEAVFPVPVCAVIVGEVIGAMVNIVALSVSYNCVKIIIGYAGVGHVLCGQI